MVYYVQLQRLAPQGYKPIRQEGQRAIFSPSRLMLVGLAQDVLTSTFATGRGRF
ncbi:hypothetical protein V7112_00510 [Bacillus sp. JJ1566]|uniref:hypothetical protein n=1 Tax=Bacillus sp. JJ1566 TaxID=3122961 RepID=UPI002FFFB540